MLNNESFASKTNSQASLGGVHEFQSHEESLELTLQRYVAKEILSKGEINLPHEERSTQKRPEGPFRSVSTRVRKDEPLEEEKSEDDAPAGLEELPEAEEHEEEGLPPPPCSTLNMPRRADAGESEGGEVSRREKLGGSISPILISNGKFKGRKLNIEKIVISKSPRQNFGVVKGNVKGGASKHSLSGLKPKVKSKIATTYKLIQSVSNACTFEGLGDNPGASAEVIAKRENDL